MGTFWVESSAKGITALEFGARRSSGTSVPVVSAPRAHKRDARATVAGELRRYAEGAKVRWSVALDLAGGTAFQRKVWRTLQQIPYGETRSYAWVARRIGKPKAARAVGAACGANPIPVIIPCHRVVASDGSLGGFTAGLAWKRKLLRLEGVAV